MYLLDIHSNFIDWLPLAVALIAGSFALSQIKSNNITNARLKWIENIRLLVNDFLSESYKLQFNEGLKISISEGLKKNPNNKIATDKLFSLNDSLVDQLTKFQHQFYLIQLQLNPQEQLHQKLEGLIHEFTSLHNKIPTIDDSLVWGSLIRSLEAYTDTIAILFRCIIKLEWERTKRSSFSRFIYFKLGRGKQLKRYAFSIQLIPERKVPDLSKIRSL